MGVKKAGQSTITLMFEDRDSDVGWSESWVSNTIDLGNAADQGLDLAKKRVAFLSGRFFIPWVRSSTNQVPLVAPAKNPRLAYLRRTNDITGSLEPQGDGDLAFVSALVRFYNADKSIFGLREFRGVPDSWWSNNKDLIPVQQLDNLMKPYVAALVASGQGMNHHPRVGANTLVIPTTSVYERLTVRKTGRPFYLSRGRAAKRTT